MIIVDSGCAGLRSAITRIDSALTAGEGCVVRAHDLTAPDLALSPVLDDPFVGTALLVRPTSTHGDARVRHHMVVGVATQVHTLNHAGHRLVGALAIQPAHAQPVRGALAELRTLLDEGLVTDDADPFALLALAVVRSGVPTRAITMVDVPWCRGEVGRVAVESHLAKLSDERIQRLQANRLDDGFTSTFVVRKLAKPLTRLALRLGLSPNAITLVSFVIGLGAAAMFAVGGWWWTLAAALALQLSLIVDCVDGEVARSTRNFTALGAWLDASTDRVKEMLVYAGLAFAAQSWQLAVALVLVQTVRHMSDYNFAFAQRHRESVVAQRSVREFADDDEARNWTTTTARINQRPLVYWVKKIIHMPIGERWLLISVVAVVAGPRWALIILLGAICLALAYVTVGRVLRTMSWRGPATSDVAHMLSRQFDAGPLLAVLARPLTWAGPWAWSYPAVLRAIELGTLAAIGLWWSPQVVILVFWWMAMVAFHDYDLLYRSLNGRAMPNWLIWLALGWDGRTIVVLAALGLGILATVLGVGIVWLALIVVFAASVQWLRTMVRAA
jgi:phosphatidylglycerophosphate synthase